MHNVVVSIKSRRVPGAMTDDEFLGTSNENEAESEELDEILTEEERRQLEVALKLDSSEMSNESEDGIIGHQHSGYESREIPIEETNGFKNGETKQEKKGWFGGWRKKETKHEVQRKVVPPRSSFRVDEKVSDLLGDSPSRSQIKPGRHSVEIVATDDHRRIRDLRIPTSMSSESSNRRKDSSRENEYKKGLRPILWLSPNFPLQIEELLPLLDILANKVKAIRRLRELLTTKLPAGTFPVKVAIPVVPTIRVLVTFTKFEELPPVDEFSTPPSSPTAGQESPAVTHSSGSWFQWIKTPYQRPSSSNHSYNKIENLQDPFAIPPNYTWITAEAKKKKMQEKSKSKKGKGQNH
ncbi:hypothetical protein Gohar_008215 [Gossypium harknessii]|uniref:Ankyrin repeat domain-containing protein n=1 Tax=Gossypium harknessii TaxID=34285 RepID=A0A7J9GIZ3_9ROSI|nr:hypothetical protein [Gossypium harknessii]